MNRMLCALLILTGLCTSAAGETWHDRLYLGNGGWWPKRIPVALHNNMSRDARGDYASVRVGTAPGEADLAGERAETARVCDAAGNEMLYAIAAPDGTSIVAGPIPAGSTITVPAECPAQTGIIYYIYCGNPSAWQVPDFLVPAGVRNGGLELGSGSAPDQWQHDPPDAEHQAFWVTEQPHAGARCLKTVVAANATPSWIASRQHSIPVIGGAEYLMRAWARAENVIGNAGWYIHVGNQGDPMIINHVFGNGGATWPWHELTFSFIAPDNADRADLGTVLWGTGTAWFDDVSLECLTPPAITATASAPEILQIAEEGANDPWIPNSPASTIAWNCRAPVRVVNLREEPVGPLLAAVELAPVLAKLQGRANAGQARVVSNGLTVPHYLVNDLLLFDCTLPPRTARTYYIYFSESTAVPDVDVSDARDGSSVPGAASYAGLLASSHNLVLNPSFELGGTLPDNWTGGSANEHPPGVTMTLEDAGLFGSRRAAIHYPDSVQKAWTGWRQNVPVQPFTTYLYAAWLKCENLVDSTQLYAHYRNANGELCQSVQYANAGPAVSGTVDWTLLYGMFAMPPDIACFQLHLTMLATGNLWHDGVVLAEVKSVTTGPLELRSLPNGILAWQVNALVKVFPDTLPPQFPAAARITAARNEKEPLQVAFRSTSEIGNVLITVVPPAKPNGAALDDVDVKVAGFVSIDYKTNYYVIDLSPWRRKIPTSAGACDGWPGFWPDPLMPVASFTAPANTTQPVWITVAVPSRAEAGDYVGKVRFVWDHAVLAELPFTVHVWNFALPVENHVSAIYDVRQDGPWWSQPGKSTQETRREFWKFMADRRLCPDRIQPEPVFHYANGVATADFTAYDEAAGYYFNVLKRPHTYTPQCFYLFGWGHPPDVKWGEAPYEGPYPYPDVNRAILRPAYKAAYQACLRLYWQHMKQKGWDRKTVLYISDEPYDAQSEIIDQMKACCTMVHEVDPAIPIYCSTWRHVPQWDGSLDVWGLGHYGTVLPPKIKELLASGKRVWWTTDGQMCIDTPYCAVERLLPHYCFQYGASAYEFWGIDWLTYDPWKFGWHSYIFQTEAPGRTVWVRYPNGDGFLAYPGLTADSGMLPSFSSSAGSVGSDGSPASFPGPVSSIRMEQAREGCEDYEYLHLLRSLLVKSESVAVDSAEAAQAAQTAAGLVAIPNAGGRYSTKILPDPDAVFRTKEAVAAAIERLIPRFRAPIWPIEGDVNNDCRVNVLDLICVRNRLGQDTAIVDNTFADVNADSAINVLDLIRVRNMLGSKCP